MREKGMKLKKDAFHYNCALLIFVTKTHEHFEIDAIELQCEFDVVDVPCSQYLTPFAVFTHLWKCAHFTQFIRLNAVD